MDIAEARRALNAGGDVRVVLPKVWNELEGGFSHGMDGSKIGRIKHPTWCDPLVTFTIERHGGPGIARVAGQLQAWRVNLVRGTAVLVSEGTRLDGDRPTWDVESLAADLASHIRGGTDESRLKWRDAHRRAVRVRYTVVFPPEWGPGDEPTRLKAAIARELGDDYEREVGAWWVRRDG